MSKIRNSEDIKYVIVNHTGHVSSVTSEQINNEYSQLGDYGAPYDIIIEKSGVISLMPRWIRSQKSNVFETNSTPIKIFKYSKHFILDINPTYYQYNSINIGVVGNYDIERPNYLVFSSLLRVLEQIYYNVGIPLQTSLLYYSEIYNNTSPGVFFFDKYYLIKSMEKITPKQKYSVEYQYDDSSLRRLLEDGSYRLLEDGTYRLLEIPK